MILRRREQLLRWLEQNAPTASIRRAVGEGSVEFLGWFKEIPGSKFPGWVMRVTSTITGIVWNVVTREDSIIRCNYCVWVLDEDPPWHTWNLTDSMNPFYHGDNLEVYRQNRENAQTQGRTEVHQENDKS